MAGALDALRAELEQFGRAHDLATADRGQRMSNITHATGELLSVLVRATGARRILEIGTSNGYSTLWLAEAANSVGGSVTTVEKVPEKGALAESNFKRSGLAGLIAQVEEDAGNVLREADDESYDFIFLDSDRSAYAGWWPDLKRVLRFGGLLVVDNATSHAGELAPLTALLAADPQFVTSLVPVGKGELLAVRTSRRA